MRPLFLLLFLATAFVACNSETPDTPPPNPPEGDSIVQDSGLMENPPAASLAPATDREPTDEELREFGIVTEVEDGPYPFFSITIEFPEREFIQSFSLNVEAIAQDQNDLFELKGKYVTLYYTSDEENMLFDIQQNGASLHPDEEEVDESWKQITGTLNGATTVSGDLPNDITIKDASGNELPFECYVTDEMIAANGQEVTVYYGIHFSNEITFIKASED